MRCEKCPSPGYCLGEDDQWACGVIRAGGVIHLPVMTKAKNLVTATIRHVANGMKSTPPEIERLRLSACMQCPLNVEGTCQSCGCPVAKKASWESESCPEGLWPDKATPGTGCGCSSPAPS